MYLVLAARVALGPARRTHPAHRRHRALIGEAVRMLRPLWRNGYRYFKAGVMLDDLHDAEAEPRSLFPTRDPDRSAKLMAALDAANARFGRGALRPLSTGIARRWGTRHAKLSPRNMTRVDELMEARVW